MVFQKRCLACPSQSPPSQGAVFHCAEFVFQEPPLWGGGPPPAHRQPGPYIIICKEARNTGFLDNLGLIFVFIAPDKIQLFNLLF